MRKIIVAASLAVALTASAASAGPRVDLSDGFTGIGAILGAAVGLAFGLPPGTITGLTALGAAGGAASYKEPDEVVNLADIPEEDRAAVVKVEYWSEFLTASWKWLVGGFLAWSFLPMVIGYYIPNGKQRRQKREMIQMKEALFDNPNITMKDLR